MAEAQMLEKYGLGDRFMYIDLKAVKRLSDISTLSFQGQRKTFNIRVPESFQRQIKAAQFPSDQTYLLIAIDAITAYDHAKLVWGISSEIQNSAFTWMFVNGAHMSMQQVTG